MKRDLERLAADVLGMDDAADIAYFPPRDEEAIVVQIDARPGVIATPPPAVIPGPGDVPGEEMFDVRAVLIILILLVLAILLMLVTRPGGI